MKNQKVVSAILSCFIIAFILQGVLKITGIFVFEKALDWQIFTIIDNSKCASLIYNSLLTTIIIYCLSFALSSKCYSNKWYHYVIILGSAFGIISIKTFTNVSDRMYIVYDLIAYILIPLIINLTTKKDYKIYINNKLANIVITITIQILLYFCYLGLTYWSGLLNSFLPTSYYLIPSSTSFLIRLEVFIGLISLMLSLNILIKNVNKGGKEHVQTSRYSYSRSYRKRTRSIKK